MKCEKCGFNMVEYKDGDIQGIKCLSCGWNIVTSNISEIDKDQMLYKIYIKFEGMVTVRHIKVVSKIGNVNYFGACVFLVAQRMMSFSRSRKAPFPFK